MDIFPIGETICKARKEKGLTQEQLGRMVGISSGAVSKWETGNAQPDISLLAPLARALDITLDTLLSFEKDMPQQAYRELTDSVRRMFVNGDIEQGRKELENARHVYPNDSNLKIFSAQIILTFIQKEDQTDEILEEVLLLYKDAAESDEPQLQQVAYLGITQIYIMQGKLKEAQSCIERLTEIYGNSTAMVLYVRLLIEQEKFDDAALICKRQLLNSLTQSTTYLSLMNQIEDKRGNEEQAAVFLKAQYNIETEFNIGLCSASLKYCHFYLKAKNFSKAAKWFMKYVNDVLEFPLDYHGDKYLDGLELQYDASGQYKIRCNMLKSLLEDEDYNELKPYEDYQTAIKIIESL